MYIQLTISDELFEHTFWMVAYQMKEVIMEKQK